LGRNPSAIVSFTIEGHDSTDVVKQADRAGITIGASDPESTLIDAERRGLPMLVRASPHYYNISPEVEALAAAIRSLS
ncbi:MAG: aminotransferase, partial [Acetobacteraceae bacterium]